MATLQEVINLARLDLNDDDKVRYTDVDLLNYVNNYIQEAIKLRPDLFLGRFKGLINKKLELTDKFPMSPRYERSCADFVIGRAHLINTEDVSIQRAGAYLELSTREGGA